MADRFKILSGRVIPETKPEIPKEVEAGYGFEEARQNLLNRFEVVAAWARGLPGGACPDGYVVIEVVLHPDRLARANFPRHFLRYLKLSVLGSHKFKVRPKRAFHAAGGPMTKDLSLPRRQKRFILNRRESPSAARRTISLYVAGKKEDLAAVAQKFRDIWPDSPASRQMACLETVNPLDAASLIKTSGDSETDSFEVALHLLPEADSDFPLAAFCVYAGEAGFTAHREHGLKAGGLVFVPVHGPRAGLLRLAQFVFVREIKEAGRMRSLTPPREAAGGEASSAPALPDQGPESTGPKVAILDGGLPDEHLIGPWLNKYVKTNIEVSDIKGGPEHGLSVASSFLFGPLPEEGPAARPLAPVNFYRVLDEGGSNENGLIMYKTLENIQKALADGPYEFVNISLGPDLPIRDDTVHAWTAVLDQMACDGKIFFTLAVGNNGRRDRGSGAARIEAPSDCVNAVGAGAADSRGPKWNRAAYSAVGPGRGPALVKPDLLAFGGWPPDYFRTLAPGSQVAVANQLGTSFASPYLLRSAVGLRVMGGDELSLLSIKCLLIHYADRSGHSHNEVGWGRAPVLDDFEARRPGNRPLIFQGELSPGNFMRADLPKPTDGGSTSVKIKATFCYSPPVAPHDPSAYTQAALDICFIPDSNAPPDEEGRPPSRPFFDADGGELDENQDAEAVLWATVKSNANDLPKKIMASPCFDIRYVDRSAAADARPVVYGLVVTMES